jgi:hypothetical protein
LTTPNRCSIAHSIAAAKAGRRRLSPEHPDRHQLRAGRDAMDDPGAGRAVADRNSADRRSLARGAATT